MALNLSTLMRDAGVTAASQRQPLSAVSSPHWHACLRAFGQDAHLSEMTFLPTSCKSLLNYHWHRWRPWEAVSDMQEVA